MIYQRKSEIIQTPEDINLPFREVYFKTPDKQKLHGWMVGKEDSKYTALFCHGNVGNISYNINFLSILYRLGLRTFIFDYRGYGKSQGSPSEDGTYIDVEAAWNHLIKKERIPKDRIILLGHSLGGAIAAQLATKVKPRALVIEASFTSIPELGKSIFPIFPVKMLSKYQYNTREVVPKLNIPILVIHSINDEVIPYQHGEVLYKLANKPKQFIKLYGSHNEGFINCAEFYIVGFRSFLSEYVY